MHRLQSLMFVMAITFVVTISSPQQVSAEECASSDLQAIKTLGDSEAFRGACGKVLGDITTASSAPLENMEKVCKDTKCADYVQSILAKLPDCEIKGIAIASSMEAALKNCKKNVRSSAGPRAGPALVLTDTIVGSIVISLLVEWAW